jgi:Family of unknown function (DUF5906)
MMPTPKSNYWRRSPARRRLDTGRGIQLRRRQFSSAALPSKSQVLGLVRGLLPPGAVSSVPPSRFGDDRHIVKLVGKLLNTSDELGTAEAIASDRFKAIITGEPLTVRDVYRPAIDFRPQAQHVFACNQLPAFHGGMDRGVIRRLMPIVFNRTIPEKERIPNIGQRVVAEELDLVLAWAVQGGALTGARSLPRPRQLARGPPRMGPRRRPGLGVARGSSHGGRA